MLMFERMNKRMPSKTWVLISAPSYTVGVKSVSASVKRGHVFLCPAQSTSGHPVRQGMPVHFGNCFPLLKLKRLEPCG